MGYMEFLIDSSSGCVYIKFHEILLYSFGEI